MKENSTIRLNPILSSKNVVIAVLFLVFAIVGLSTYKDYGLSWDETRQREIGMMSYDYIAGKNTDMLDFEDKDYGVAFELPLIFLEKAIGAEDFREIFLMRHLATHFLFLLSGVVLYLIAFKISKSKLVAACATLFLFLHPRIYGHSFFNTKDIPLLCFFIFCLYAVQLYMEKQTTKRLVLFAMTAALATNIRIISAVIPMYFGGYLIYLYIKSHYNTKYLKHIIWCVCSFVAVLIISWPYLWSNPLANFIQVFKNMIDFRWESIMLYRGEVISSLEVPRSYLPTWHAITTPILFLLVEILGFTLFIKLLVRDENDALSFNKKIFFFLQLHIILLPLLVVFIFGSVVYDSWRQFFFMYPSLILFSILVIQYIKKKYETWLYSAVILLFIPSLLQMIIYHPFQQTFFTEAFLFKHRNYATSNYEMDYWGTAYGSAIKTILKKDKREKIKISSDLDPGYINYLFLPTKYKEKIEWVQIKDAEYIITNLRWRYQGFEEYEDQLLDHIETPTGTISITYRTDNEKVN